METLEKLQRRIDTTEDLYSIVRTMKALAAVNIRSFEKAVESLADYTRNVETGFQVLLLHHPDIRASITSAPRQRAGILIFGSDQGLCGPLNDRIVAHAREEMTQMKLTRSNSRILAVGGQIAARFGEVGETSDATCRMPGSIAGITPAVQSILLQIDAWQTHNEIDQIILFYSQHLSRSTYSPKTEHLLPLDQVWLDAIAAEPWPSRCLPMINVGPDQLFSALTRQFLFISIYRALAETLASENASRLASMRRAEQNIQEQSQELRLRFHQQRQESVTEELLDIVSAFEALKSPKR